MEPIPVRPVLSRRAFDAIAACIEMARQGHDYVGVAQLSQSIGLSTRRLELALTPLVDGQLLDTKRGRHGGYRLFTSPDQVRASQVVAAIERAAAAEPTDPDRIAETARWLHDDLEGLVLGRLSGLTIAALAGLGTTQP